MRTITWVLVVAAAIRLGIIGFLGDDFIGLAFGSAPVTMSWVDRVVCGIVGIAGIYAIYLLFKGTNSEVA
ncbi:DUF378 domain-containing protein [Clostridium beijerinckii]|uniref:DUF378 domain-containing protein n=1 Tax=Clostridium beijerinckii TaxID=1520 RepID=A0A140DMC5_CLOBE|nr:MULTISPECIES: DUF378 domain-containing protein [Clostridium]AMK50400.1 hypothetical protein LF65_06275 [Clostridium beijerinckii]MBA8935111.1 hypothetical protein [Clostridium beijerinckii]MBN7575121.1 DUF378 domain-containing protein [Clostridium beijerinckii]MBN7580411.1 DUF378 domain-containing protein [Clostridium beijerinckii]MBN7584885.1 DUF378 domain-containing protein [Clostridium beijerinckii]